MSYTNRDGAEGTLAAMRASNRAIPAAAVTVAHLGGTVSSELAHVQRHLQHATDDGSPEAMAFDVKHAHHHAGIAAEHHDRLLGHIAERDPEVGAELDKLREATPGADEFEPAPGAADPPVTDEHEAMIQP